MVLPACQRLNIFFIRFVIVAVCWIRFFYGFLDSDILGVFSSDKMGAAEMLKLKFEPTYVSAFFFFQFMFSLHTLIVLCYSNKTLYNTIKYLAGFAFCISLFMAIFTVIMKNLYEMNKKIYFITWNEKVIELAFSVFITFTSLIEIINIFKANNVLENAPTPPCISPNLEEDSPPSLEQGENRYSTNTVSSQIDLTLTTSAPPMSSDFWEQPAHNPFHSRNRPSNIPAEWFEMQNNSTISATNLEEVFGPPPQYKP